MAQLLCPYCPQVYADTIHLAAHVHRTHRDAAGPIDRAMAVAEARTVADVDVVSPALVEQAAPACGVCGQTPPYKLYENFEGNLFCKPCADPSLTEPQHETPCFCGAPLVLDDVEFPRWHHEYPPPKCRAAVPAAGLPSPQDRADLIVALAGNTARAELIRDDLAALRGKLDTVTATLERAEAAALRPDAVRRMTLSQVLDKLLDAGYMGAYALVSQMLRDGS